MERADFRGEKDVDEYLARVPEPSRSALSKIRAAIRSVVPPETTEGMSYGMPAFHYQGWLVWYAAFAKHCSLFPLNSSLAEMFKDELKGFQTSKGTLRFTAERPLPASLVKKLVKARIAQNQKKNRKKR